MKTPIIVDNFGELLIFDTVDRAERALEPIDVLEGEYIVYDSEGRLLRALAPNDYDRISIKEAENTPQRQKQLRNALIAFLSRLPGEDSEQIVHSSLEELVEKGSKYPTW